MLVVMASSKASPKKPRCATMHPLLAAAACRGNLQELKFLLKREQGDNLTTEFIDQAKAYKIIIDNTTSTTITGQQATANNSDVEQGHIDEVELLNGVTVAGDTVLHLVAANGDAQNFLECTGFIHDLEKGLLSTENDNRDTPMHCAARAGRTKMVSRLIDLAKDDGTVEQLLRKLNKRKETVLHEAVRIGDNHMVAELLRADGGLASFPEGKKDTSALYLAIALRRGQIAKTLHHDESENRRPLSYSGPDEQNALHAAVLRGPELTGLVLKWNTNKDLTTQRDKNGRTPLHFAAGLVKDDRRRPVFSQVLEANPSALYQPDNDGLYPIHVAASAGATQAIHLIVKRCGGTSAGLLDANGGTFLHVAVSKIRVGIVGYVCRNRSLAWILNMQDNDGNTALHLAVQARQLRMFCALLGNRHVSIDLANMEGETPLDIAHYQIPPRVFFFQNSEVQILQALQATGAKRGTCLHQDHFKEKYEQIHGPQTEHEKKAMEAVKDSTETLCVGSVLIATVTFGATFALPGGYKSDDHPNGGTPTLAGRYAFDAFVMANTLAFMFSSATTLLLIRSGSPYVNKQNRKLYSGIAYFLADVSVTCLVGAFAMAVYVVLDPVARRTAITACVLSLVIVLCNRADAWLKWAMIAPPLFVRRGALRSLFKVYPVELPVGMFFGFWPVLLIIFLVYVARNNPIPMLKSFFGTIWHLLNRPL